MKKLMLLGLIFARCVFAAEKEKAEAFFERAERLAVAGEEVVTLAVECDGKKFIYTDCMQLMVGGGPDHFIVVREELPEFKDLRLHSESEPNRPWVPYLSLGKFKVPLSEPGLYRLKKVDDSVVLEFLSRSILMQKDESVEDFICRTLKGPNKPNQAPEPTPGSVTPRATEGASK